MEWHRRRDLEGGKELGIWLLIDGESVERELYVETHEYRGGAFDVYTATPDGEWTHHGEFPSVGEAFGAAFDRIEESGYPLDEY